MLRIFVFEKLSSYKTFYEANAEYLKELGKYINLGQLNIYHMSPPHTHTHTHTLIHTCAHTIIHLGLDNDFCITKMRQLTLTSLAVEAESGEVPFSTLLAQLDIPREELELFLIDGM